MLYNKAIGATASAQKIYIEDVFSTYLYTGNGSTQTITNGIDLSGKGGLVWTKGRSATLDNTFIDTARGAGKQIYSSLTLAEQTQSTSLTTFGTTGYSLGADNGSISGEVNASGATYVSWTFRKAAKFFDVVTYTGNGANRTISHNLGSVPGTIFIKRTDSAADWQVYHRSLANTEYLVLNSTAAKATGATRWNSTTPTSTELSLGTDTTVNANGGTYVAYLFAHDAGGFGDSGNDNVISCGSYTGNGSPSGPTVTLGWEPQWLLVKRSSSINDWILVDNLRGFPVTGETKYVNPNTSSAESGFGLITPLSTGFQPRTFDSTVNSNTQTYIYIAIRRGPMKTPTDATKVFLTATVTNDSTQTVTTNFPVDTILESSRGASSVSYFLSRLTGEQYLATSTTGAESSGANIWYDSSVAVKPTNLFAGQAVYQLFRRAPGFFDVVAYDGGGTSKNHNLGVKPELAFIKVRSTSFRNWIAAVQGGTGGYLNTSDPINGSNLFIDLANATSTTFPINGNTEVGQSGQTYIAYLFATCPGVSKVGSYTGTGTTKQIDCGFTNGARFVLIKRTDNTGDWYVWDTARGIVSGNDNYLLLNSTAAEVTNTDYIDPLSSGFEISSSAPAAINANGGSYIFLAIA